MKQIRFFCVSVLLGSALLVNCTGCGGGNTVVEQEELSAEEQAAREQELTEELEGTRADAGGGRGVSKGGQ